MSVRVRYNRSLTRVRRFVNRHLGPWWLRAYLRRTDNPRIVLGAGPTHYPGWSSTDRDFLNLLEPSDWQRHFQPNSIAAFLAEHVWEHLTPEQGREAAARCFTYLRPGGYLRLAVPDGLHPSPGYQEAVQIGRGGHKSLYTYATLSAMLREIGFTVVLYEYFNEQGDFLAEPWDVQHGMIRRSKQYDRRNRDGRPVYTSIILDAVKPPSISNTTGSKGLQMQGAGIQTSPLAG